MHQHVVQDTPALDAPVTHDTLRSELIRSELMGSAAVVDYMPPHLHTTVRKWRCSMQGLPLEGISFLEASLS